jgi:hypothetical protein
MELRGGGRRGRQCEEEEEIFGVAYQETVEEC